MSVFASKFYKGQDKFGGKNLDLYFSPDKAGKLMELLQSLVDAKGLKVRLKFKTHPEFGESVSIHAIAANGQTAPAPYRQEMTQAKKAAPAQSVTPQQVVKKVYGAHPAEEAPVAAVPADDFF